MISEHLPALQVVVPLMAAPLIVLLRRPSLGWLVSTLAAWSAFAIAIALLVDVGERGTISYAIGSWEPPWGIEYRVDAVNAYVLVLVALIAAVIAPYAWRSIAAEVPRDQQYLAYAMVCLCLAGLLGITITGDAFNLFVFLEISSLASYVLIALGRDRRALLAAYQYLVLGTIGATFIVIGVGLLYLMTGTLNLVDMAARLEGIRGTRPVLAALAFLTVGICLKLALFPLHFWLPNAYAYAPSAVTALLAGTATKVSLYVLLRFYYSVFGATEVFQALPMREVLLALSVAAMFIASMQAAFQGNLKHLLAYSSVGQIGYITLGVAIGNHTGITASILHLFNHGITKAALFLLAGGIALRARSLALVHLAGIGRTMPVTSAAVVIGGFSLIGVPATAGFVTKWYLVLAAIEAKQWLVAFLPVASSLIALWYMWRFVEVAYFREPTDATPRAEPPAVLLVPALVLTALVVYTGIDSTHTIALAAKAASVFVGGAR